jgi:DNA-binding IclR family transcriptional regulator
VLAAEHGPTSLAHLAQTLGLAKPTTHGLVQTLRDVGFVDQDPDSGDYALSPDLLAMGAVSVDPNELRSRALNWADSLAARTHEAVLVTTRRDDVMIVAHHVFRPDSSAQTLLTGCAGPLHTNAFGKVLLAHDPRSFRRLQQQRLERHTYRTITDPGLLQRELATVRDLGWAGAVEEAEPEIASVAAPVRDRAGFVVAAVGVTGSIETVCDARRHPRQALATQVMAAARSISRELGHGRR